MAGMDDVQKSVQNLTKGFSITQILSFVITVVLIVLVMVFVFKWSMKPDYTILFSNLDLKDADQITQALEAQGVQYKVSAGGTAVLVPSKNVSEWRMRMATQGLPSSSVVGYEIFDKNDIGISDFVQQVNYLRALEGELSRTIQGINGIQGARVHIVIPKDRLFTEDQEEPSASIALGLRGNMRLNESQVFGITNLVAASVEGLDPEGVTIVDSRGNVLSKPYGEDSMLGLSSSQLDMQHKVESYLANKAETMLASIVGSENAVVRVTAQLNFQRIERTDERYDPENQAVLSEERTDESASDSVGNPLTQTEHSVTNYHVPKTIEHVTNSVGNITRLSVAVLVDGIRTRTTDENGVDQENYQPRCAQDLAMFTAIVKNAVGFDLTRNDQFDIQNIAFNTNEEIMEETPESFISRYSDYISIAQKVAPFILLGVFLMILRGRFKKIKVNIPAAVAPVATVGASMPQVTMADMDVGSIEEGASPEMMEGTKLSKQITQFAQEKPALAARLLRYWMIEE